MGEAEREFERVMRTRRLRLQLILETFGGSSSSSSMYLLYTTWRFYTIIANVILQVMVNNHYNIVIAI